MPLLSKHGGGLCGASEGYIEKWSDPAILLDLKDKTGAELAGSECATTHFAIITKWPKLPTGYALAETALETARRGGLATLRQTRPGCITSQPLDLPGLPGSGNMSTQTRIVVRATTGEKVQLTLKKITRHFFRVQRRESEKKSVQILVTVLND